MRLRNREITPFNSIKPHSNSLKRARFYDAFDRRNVYPRVTALEVFKEQHVPRSTAYDWLRERDEIGQIAARRHDGRVEKQLLRGTVGSGRPRKITNYQLNQLLTSTQSARRQPLYTQLRNAQIDTSLRTLQRALRDRAHAGMCRASTQKEITDPQALQRQNHCAVNQYKAVVGFWDGVLFTDEAHMALNDFPAEWILRIYGERSAPYNVVNHADRSANVVHFAAWINYYTKADELIFYNDEYDDHEPVKPPPKPRRRPTTDQPGDYETRMREWEAAKAREPVVTKPGNSMRASYYVEKILPSYCVAYSSLVAQSDDLRAYLPQEERYNWYLVEDNDPSHGTRNSDSLPAVYRRDRGVVILNHPANSPDLNPIEGIWNIIKERVKQQLHQINTIAELKAALQHELKQIRQEMVQERIDEMPYRCRQVFRYPSVRVKTDRW